MTRLKCEKCHSDLQENDKFCPMCGNPINAENSALSMNEKNTISSTGTFSGTLTKGKKSKAFKYLRNTVIVMILAGVIAVIVWFQVDPDAGKKLKDVGFGIIFMAFFFLVGWLFMRGKKGKSENWDDDQFYEPNYADNDDND